MNAVILGNGRSGQAAAALLRRDGWRVRILDGDDPWQDDTCDLCVASPGVPASHPWQTAAHAAGVPVISELQLGAERYRAMGGDMLAVTGSKGKSSVVKLVADALGGIPCGNYGTPLCEVVANLQPSPLNSRIPIMGEMWGQTLKRRETIRRSSREAISTIRCCGITVCARWRFCVPQGWATQ